MCNAALGDVVKVILYVIASFILAALMSPYLYEIGKAFAHVALSKDTADQVAWLAKKAGKAEFDTYFKRSLLLSAALLLVPLFYSLRLSEGTDPVKSGLWTLGRPGKFGQPLQRVRLGFLQALVGFLITTGFFFLMAWCLFALGWFEWKREPSTGKLLEAAGRAIKTAVGVSLVEEWFFRGALLGIFLRAFRPMTAITSLSLLFAAAHFLVPSDDAVVVDPRSAMAGFEMLGLIGERFLDPATLMQGFVTLFLVGVILGVARYGTASLWLPIGLHAGWVFASKIFGRMAMKRPDFPEEWTLYIGGRLTEGAIPLAFITLTGVVVGCYLRVIRSEDRGEKSEEAFAS